MDDFEPENVVKQVEPLRLLLEARQKLADLKTKVVSNDKLDNVLQRIIQETDERKRKAARPRLRRQVPPNRRRRPRRRPDP